MPPTCHGADSSVCRRGIRIPVGTRARLPNTRGKRRRLWVGTPPAAPRLPHRPSQRKRKTRDESYAGQGRGSTLLRSFALHGLRGLALFFVTAMSATRAAFHPIIVASSHFSLFPVYPRFLTQ